MERVTVYVDGLNLYYGLKSADWQRFYWLDLQRLSENLIRPSYQRLHSVRYFTAKFLPKDDAPGQVYRQGAYLQALSSLPKVSIECAFHHKTKIPCPNPNCETKIIRYEEKMTDVNIAVALLADAYDDRYDTAILISADSDLTRPISAVRQKFANKRVLVAFPPNRKSRLIKEAANETIDIGKDKLRDSQFPNPVTKPDGYLIPKPAIWI